MGGRVPLFSHHGPLSEQLLGWGGTGWQWGTGYPSVVTVAPCWNSSWRVGWEGWEWGVWG